METSANPQTLPGQPLDFDKVIEQSKQNLADVTEAPKRGRGRPKGTFKTKPQGEENPPKEDGFKDVDGVILAQNEIEPLANEIIKAPFDVVGWRTGIDVSPDDTEAKAPTKYLSRLIECYLPDLNIKDPKSFNLIALIISFALLSIRKFRVFAVINKKKKQLEEAQNQKPKETQSEIIVEKTQNRPLPTESVPSANLFNNRIM